MFKKMCRNIKGKCSDACGRKERKKNCVNVWLGTPGTLTVLQLLPMTLAAQPPFKQTTEIERNIGHCSLPWECRQLWRRKHFNSPLSSICACGGSYGCRRPLFITTDRLQICWFAERWEEAGCVRVSLWWSARWNRPDSGGNQCLSNCSNWQFHPFCLEMPDFPLP